MVGIDAQKDNGCFRSSDDFSVQRQIESSWENPSLLSHKVTFQKCRSDFMCFSGNRGIVGTSRACSQNLCGTGSAKLHWHSPQTRRLRLTNQPHRPKNLKPLSSSWWSNGPWEQIQGQMDNQMMDTEATLSRSLVKKKSRSLVGSSIFLTQVCHKQADKSRTATKTRQDRTTELDTFKDNHPAEARRTSRFK